MAVTAKTRIYDMEVALSLVDSGPDITVVPSDVRDEEIGNAKLVRDIVRTAIGDNLSDLSPADGIPEYKLLYDAMVFLGVDKPVIRLEGVSPGTIGQVY